MTDEKPEQHQTEQKGADQTLEEINPNVIDNPEQLARTVGTPKDEEAMDEEGAPEVMKALASQAGQRSRAPAQARGKPPQQHRGSGPAGVRESYAPSARDFEDPFQYIIEPRIPDEYMNWFKHFRAMISNILPHANIMRRDIPRYLNYFDSLWLWLKDRGARIDPTARQSFRITMELQLTRAVDMAERKIQVTERREQTVEGGGKEDEGGILPIP